MHQQMNAKDRQCVDCRNQPVVCIGLAWSAVDCSGLPWAALECQHHTYSWQPRENSDLFPNVDQISYSFFFVNIWEKLRKIKYYSLRYCSIKLKTKHQRTESREPPWHSWPNRWPCLTRKLNCIIGFPELPTHDLRYFDPKYVLF